MEVEMIGRMLIAGVVVPGIVALVLMLVIWPSSQRRRDRYPLWAGGLVTLLAFLSATFLLKGLPRWPVPSSADWLPFIAVLGLLLGLFSTMQGLPPATVAMLRGIMSIATIWLSTLSLQQNSWKGGSWGYILGLSALLFVVWSIWELLASRNRGALFPLLLTVNLTALAIATLLGRSATVSQQAGVLCAVIGAFFVVALIRPNLYLSHTTLFVVMPLFAGILINAHFYAYLGGLHAGLLLLCTPMALFAVQATRRMSPALMLIVAALLTALPFLASGVIQIAAGQHVTADDEEDPYAEYYN